MTTNPFLEWPFWHYFTLHMQNISYFNDVMRMLKFDTPMLLNNLSKPDHNIPSESKEGYIQLHKAILGSVFYDFMNDVIVKVSDINVPIYIVSPAGLNSNAGRDISLLSSMIILKGVGKKSDSGIVGGELMPMISTPNYMRMISTVMPSVQAIAEGKTLDPNATKPDVLALLSDEDKKKISLLRGRSIYENILIGKILNSYKLQKVSTSGTVLVDKIVSKITKALMKPIQENRAINVSTGAAVMTASACYNIEEYKVTIPNTTETRVVKFAFPITRIKDEDKNTYRQMLISRFNATKEISTQVSTDSRTAITLKAVEATASDYPTMLSNTITDFQSYIANLNKSHIVANQFADVSQTLSNIAPESQIEEAQIEDDLDQPDEDYDNVDEY